MKKIYYTLYGIMGVTLYTIFSTQKVFAEILNSNFAQEVSAETGISNTTTPIDTTITLITTLLTLLGIVTVVLIIYSGFRWMTAAGNEEQITEAKGILKAAVIGAAIILFSYTIAQFIFSNLESATGQQAIK